MFALNVKTKQKNKTSDPSFQISVVSISSKQNHHLLCYSRKMELFWVFLVIHQPSVDLGQEFCVFWPV